MSTELPLGMTSEDLPVWMRKARREIDWTFLVVAVLWLIVIWPLIARSGIPHVVGLQMQVARTIEMSESIQSGILYPRWAADFYYGYGSPLWNYLAPLPHYLTGLHYVLSPSNPQTSVKFILILSLGMGGLGLFSFVRRRWGAYAGLLAGALFLFSPQIALVKPYLEGDLPGLLAVGWLVLAFWAFDRLLSIGRGWDIAVAALMVAGLWLTLTPMNLVYGAVLTGWLVWRMAVDRMWPRRVWVALGLGTGISAFYWLPAWFERSAVRWHSITPYSVDNWGRLSPLALLSPPHQLDLSAINPGSTVSLGIAVWGLAVIAIISMFVSGWRQTLPAAGGSARGDVLQKRLVSMIRLIPAPDWEALYFATVGIVLVLLVTPVAGPLWDALPLWPSLYPRDMLPLLVVCGVIVGAQVGTLLESMTRRTIGAAGMIVLLSAIALLALPILYPPVWPTSRSLPDLSFVLRDEVRGYSIASQMSGWLLPKSISEPPSPSPSLIASYQNEAIDKVARDRLPPATKVDLVEHTLRSERLVVKSTAPVELTLLTFNFPGWQAQIDGNEVHIDSAADTGLIELHVPEGQHEVFVHFGSTFPRDIGWTIAGLACVATLIISIRREYTVDTLKEKESVVLFQSVQTKGVLLSAVLVLGGGSLVARLAPQLVTFRSPPGIVLSADAQLPRALDGGIDLLAYDIEPDGPVRPGDELTIVLYWRAWRPDLPDYQVNLEVLNSENPDEGIIFAKRRHPGMIPSSQWTAWSLFDYYVRDAYHLKVDRNIDLGDYQIVIQVGQCNQFNVLPCESLEPLFVRDGRGEVLGQYIVIPAVITVQR